jgi:hypothetical protein
LNQKQKAAVADAVKALAKIKAAVEVGVSLVQYSQLVIDAKAVVNEAERILPASEILANLSGAMVAYKDAATVWNRKLNTTRVLFTKEDGLEDIVARYTLPSREWKPGNLEKKGETAVYFDVGIQFIWAVATDKLAKARALE